MKTSPSELTPAEYRNLKSKRPRKYRNQPVTVSGITFDSTKEAGRFMHLTDLQNRELIWGLEYHKTFDIEVNKQLICRYEADFTYFDKDHPFNPVVEDVKSEITRKLPVYRLKKKLLLAVHGIEIIEI